MSSCCHPTLQLCNTVKVVTYVLYLSYQSVYSFSHSGNVLCSVGKEISSGGRSKITLWNTSLLREPAGEVEALATTHTDADVSCMKMAQFDDTR